MCAMHVDPADFDSVFESYGYAAGTVPQEFNPFGFNTDGTLFTMGNGEPGSVANFRGQGDPLTSNSYAHSYNSAKFVALQMPLTRGPPTRPELRPDRRPRVVRSGIYADYTVKTQVAPVPLQGVVMPPTNPFIPADLKRLLDSRLNRTNHSTLASD